MEQELLSEKISAGMAFVNRHMVSRFVAMTFPRERDVKKAYREIKADHQVVEYGNMMSKFINYFEIQQVVIFRECNTGLPENKIAQCYFNYF